MEQVKEILTYVALAAVILVAAVGSVVLRLKLNLWMERAIDKSLQGSDKL